jgi:hypothetical protein
MHTDLRESVLICGPLFFPAGVGPVRPRSEKLTMSLHAKTLNLFAQLSRISEAEGFRR